MADLLVNLYHRENGLEEGAGKQCPGFGTVEVYRAMSSDKGRVLSFVAKHFEENWVRECEYAFANSPISCLVAVKEGGLLGFACYDATAKGYFGPVGIKPQAKGKGIGQKLLYSTLSAMKDAGYGYAVIGWMDEAIGFYKKSLPVYEIPDSEKENTIYRGLLADEER